MFVRAALQGRQLFSCPAVTPTGVYGGAMVRARAMHVSLPRSSEAAPATETDEPVVYALERSSPLIHTRMSYLSPKTRPDSQEKHYVPMSAHVFNVPPHQHAMHMAVVYYLDAMRMGTASTKTRSEVAFSGRKLRPQKGSGKARLGDAGSPMLRKGGVAHGPRPRDFKTELPRKVRELALRSALSARMREGRLHVVPSLEWQPAPMSTNKLARLLGSKQWTDTLFLTAPRRPLSPVSTERGAARASSVDLEYTDEQVLRHARYVRNFDVASRNLPDVALMRLHALEPHPQPRLEHTKQPGELHAYEVLQFSRIVMDLGALEWLEEKLGGSLVHEMYKEELRFWEAECKQDALPEDAPAPSEEPAAPAPAPAPTPSP
ncbi:Similar to S.cerevisiae protein YML6 (Mitochondrial ribosomal protein of the large subunit) [Malassezia sympodialis ATCC 42132]|uniref:Large ribosomal subunit protein uL4m n=2 Tax=Malassezia sympodialis (strain ATCC 42132) TaxID=1230383 RepID=A0A1M8AAJ5_MALS4|nr:Similar to S.cerevisiae protein YML6 (Mitochondrial ribosomal protein of the large subunit) [Malassezia sympodialis ATCC 42132]